MIDNRINYVVYEVGGGKGGVSVPKKNKCFTIIIHIGSFIIKNHAVQIAQLNHFFSFRYRKKNPPPFQPLKSWTTWLNSIANHTLGLTIELNHVVHENKWFSVSLGKKKTNTNRFWLPFSKPSHLLSRKPMHCLFRLFFCLFLFKQPVVWYSSLNRWCVFH